MTDQPVGDIIKSITDDVKLLVRDEIELAKAELMPAAKNGGIGAGLFGAPATSRSAPCRCSTSRPRFGLVDRFDWPVWLGFLVVGVALFLVAGICGGDRLHAGQEGQGRRSAPSPRPTRR